MTTTSSNNDHERDADVASPAGLRRYREGYFSKAASASALPEIEAALDRAVDRTRKTVQIAGLRNPRIGTADNRWTYCEPGDWVMGFFSGQLWLAYTLTGDAAFADAVRNRQFQFRRVLDDRSLQDHDLGFLFSLHAVAGWRVTGDPAYRDMALEAARLLICRFRSEGGYIQAWNPAGPEDRARARFANGRMIADTMQNIALLYWAHGETGRHDFFEVAELHAGASARHLLRPDGTSFHSFCFDPATGEPVGGETHQGYADDSCWSRGQAWLLHGFAQSYRTSGNPRWLDAARRIATKTEELMGAADVPVWDYALDPAQGHPIDSAAGAVMAAGLFLLAEVTEGEEADRWTRLAERCLYGLLKSCDLTRDPDAEGLLAHGAAFVKEGRADNMLPYGDYFYFEALMRAAGHREFFW